ncbi:MAG: hypothetical protein HeimC2_23600 [Candidatus Heimdallarchaeota archaeon LC_2]|nr:MAG: hypothetical protein HeimC2_23600 [Candidatus Heimdallarchaeota archaeon LC_2]
MRNILAAIGITFLFAKLLEWAEREDGEQKKYKLVKIVSSLNNEIKESKWDLWKKLANKISTSMLIIFTLVFGISLLLLGEIDLTSLLIGDLIIVIVISVILHQDFQWEIKRMEYFLVVGKFYEDFFNIRNNDFFIHEYREEMRKDITEKIKESDEILEGDDMKFSDIIHSKLYSNNREGVINSIIKSSEIYYYLESLKTSNFYQKTCRDKWWIFWKPNLLDTVETYNSVSNELITEKTGFEQKLVDRIVITILLGFLYSLLTQYENLIGNIIPYSIFSMLGILIIVSVTIFIISYFAMNYPLLRKEIIISYNKFSKVNFDTAEVLGVDNNIINVNSD